MWALGERRLMQLLPVCVCAVPSVLLPFSHLHPQELVRPQPSDGLREVCLRLLLRHSLGREVESFCWWIYLGSASGGSCCFQAISQVISLKLLQISCSPVVLLLSALFSNQTENPKSAHLDTITVQHLFEKQTIFVSSYGYEMVAPKQKPNTKWNKTSTVLLHEFTAFGEEEKGVNT